MQDLIQEIKANLEKEESRIREELSRFAEHDSTTDDFTTQFEDIGRSMDDNAHEVGIYGDRLALEQTMEKRLDQIVQALRNIETGTYGTCEKCGEKIAKERLIANPEAAICMACAE